jgi:hypothetical protein
VDKRSVCGDDEVVIRLSCRVCLHTDSNCEAE